MAAPAAFPNPPGARAGCQPQHGQPRPPPETPRTRLFTAALGGRGSPGGTGGEVHTRSTPPTEHHFGSPGPKLSCAAFCQPSSPSNPGFGERSFAPQLLPPGTSPGKMGGTRPPGEVRGVRGGAGGVRGGTGGVTGGRGPCQLPQHCHTKVWGMGGCAPAPSAQPRCPPRLHPRPPRGGHEPRPEATRAGAGGTAMRGRVRGTPPHP